MSSKKYGVKIFCLLFLTFSLIFLSLKAVDIIAQQIYSQQNTISISADTNIFNIGSTFDVDVLINTNCAVNAAQAIISFPQDKLEVVSISKESSIIDFWLEEPEFDNQHGMVELTGLILDDDCVGETMLATISFLAKDIGMVNIDFIKASLLSADCEANETIDATKKISFTIVDLASPPTFDVNNDDKIDIKDLSIFISHFKKNYQIAYDFNQDGKIDMIDLSILVYHAIVE